MAARGNRNNLAPDTGMSSWREVDRDYLPLHHQEVLTMIKWSDAAVEAAARAMCKSGRYETGQGTCAALCMGQLGDPRKWGCRHAVDVHGKAATAALRAAYAVDAVSSGGQPGGEAFC